MSVKADQSKEKKAVFQNMTAVDQVVYTDFDTHAPVTIPPGGTVEGECFRHLAGKGKPFKQVKE